VGFGESLVTRYRFDIEEFLGIGVLPGIERAVPFLVILAVLVIRGRGLPLRSHVTDRLPKLGTGRLNVPGILIGAAIAIGLLFGVMDDRWAQATYVSATSAVVVLSIVVLTGYAGQLSLGQWALAGAGAFIAGNLVLRLDWPVEIAVPLGILLAIPVGLLFALPALRTRGVNLAIVTLGLGYAIQAVVFTKQDWIAEGVDGGTRVGDPDLFGWPIDAGRHPHRWALVCIVAFVLTAVVVANLRRSQTGRRLIAVRTNERAAASLGISVFGVKLYAFAIAGAIASLAGILVGFRSSLVTYEQYSPFESIFSVGWAVLGGLGFVLGAVFSAPNALGGLGTRLLDDVLGLGEWDALVGGVAVLLIILVHQDGIAEVVAHQVAALRSRLARRPPPELRLPVPSTTPVRPATLAVEDLTVRFGGVIAVDGVSLEVRPGEVVGLIGPNGAGKTTVIDAVTGFVRPAAGRVTLDGEPIDGWSATRRARHGLRRSFQSLELFEDATVEDNIRAGSDTIASPWSWLTDLVWPRRPPLSDTAVAAIHEFALQPHLGRHLDELPYGARRLVGIARAVASGPSVVMLDEPAAGLDERESAELAALIRRLADDRNMAVLLVEHDVNLVMTTCDRVVVLNFGRVIASGPPAEIRNHPEVRLAYLGSIEGEEPTVGPPSESVGSTQ
jgi:sulfate-transporting ATPase